MNISTAIQKWLESKQDSLSESTVSDVETIGEVTGELGLHRKTFDSLTHSQRLSLSRKASQKTGLRRVAVEQFLEVIETWANEVSEDDSGDNQGSDSTPDGVDETDLEDLTSDDEELLDSDLEALSEGVSGEVDTETAADTTDRETAASEDADDSDTAASEDAGDSLLEVPEGQTIFSVEGDTETLEGDDDSIDDVEPMPVSSSGFADTLNAGNSEESSPETSFLQTLEGSTALDETGDVNVESTTSDEESEVDATTVYEADIATGGDTDVEGDGDSSGDKPQKKEVDYVMYAYFAVAAIALCLSVYFFLNAQK